MLPAVRLIRGPDRIALHDGAVKDDATMATTHSRTCGCIAALMGTVALGIVAWVAWFQSMYIWPPPRPMFHDLYAVPDFGSFGPKWLCNYPFPDRLGNFMFVDQTDNFVVLLRTAQSDPAEAFGAFVFQPDVQSTQFILRPNGDTHICNIPRQCDCLVVILPDGSTVHFDIAEDVAQTLQQSGSCFTRQDLPAKVHSVLEEPSKSRFERLFPRLRHEPPVDSTDDSPR